MDAHGIQADLSSKSTGPPMNTFRACGFLACTALLVSACAAAGQRPQPVNPANPSPASPATVLHAQTNLVLVDVVVLDRGKPVHGLSKSRFHVFEDGHEQAISSFDEHQPPVMPPNAAKVTADIAALPPHTYTNVSPYPDTGTVNVLLLDALNTPLADQQQARKDMVEYLTKIPQGTPVAIFTLASRLQLVTGFTTNAAQLADAVKTRSASSQSVVLEEQADSTQSVMDSQIANMEMDGLPSDAIGALQEFEADFTAFQTNLRVQMTLDAFQELARYLSGVPGRKNVIWFSGSFPITIDPDPSLPRSFRNVEEYATQIRQTGSLLTAARVAVYPVDARGLFTSPTTAVNYTPAPPAPASRPARGGSVQRGTPPGTGGDPVQKDYTKFLNQTAEEHESMDTIAEETGGKAFYNANNLKAAAEDAIEDGSSYYTIAYDPGPQKFDGSFRRIKVSVEKGSFKLAFRNGYYADPAYGPGMGIQNPEGANLIRSAILHGAPPSTQLHFMARVLPATDPLLKDAKIPDGPAGKMAASIKGTPHRYVIDMDIDPRGFLFSDAPDGGHETKMEFVLVDYDTDGNVLNSQDQAMDVTLKTQQYETILKGGLHARIFIDVPAGRESLRIAVQDLNAGRAGSLEVPLMVRK